MNKSGSSSTDPACGFRSLLRYATVDAIRGVGAAASKPLGGTRVGSDVAEKRAVFVVREVLGLFGDDTHLGPVLQIFADTWKVNDLKRMPWRDSSWAGPIPESFRSCGLLKAPAERITSRLAVICCGDGALPAGFGSARYRRVAFMYSTPVAIVPSNSTSRHQTVLLDDQVVRQRGGRRQDELAHAPPLASRRPEH